MKCEICGGDHGERYSCNAMPIVNGRCCMTCDDLIVSPVRILQRTYPDAANEIVALFRSSVKTHAHLKRERLKLTKGQHGQAQDQR